jgi:hypothetical protein
MPALARFYDPQIGRFLTPDPAGTIDSPNLYAYVLNDPINFTDPSGLCETVTGSRICRSQLTAQVIIDNGDGASGGGGRGRGGGASGGGGGGGGCAPSPDLGPDDILVCGRRIPRMPFNPGPAFPISFFDPIFGRTPGRMDLPPEISPDPEPGMMGEMMGRESVRQAACEAGFGFAGGVAGALVGGVIVGSVLATAPAGAAVAIGVAAIAAGGTIAGLAVDAFFGPAAGGGAAIVGGLSVPFAAAGFRGAFSGAAGRVAVFGIGGLTPARLVTGGTAFVGALAGGALGGALCSRRG